MKRLILLISMAGFLFSCSESGWKDLLDEDLSHWRTYQSYALTNEYVPYERPCDENGNPIEPIGYDVNLDNEFHVMELDGEKDIPLTEGRIQLQSEAAEVYYKDVMIRKMNKLPEEFEKMF